MDVPIQFRARVEVGVDGREEPGGDPGRADVVDEMIEEECRQHLVCVERERRQVEERRDRLDEGGEEGRRCEEWVQHVG